MKTIMFILTIFFAASNFLNAQSEQEMKAWMDYMTPGAPHQMLAAADGEWEANVSMWMDPDSPPNTSTGTAVNKMIHGGRYQYSTFTGNMMGMPFEGIGITGYDNAEKVYVSTWIDNMGTGMMMMKGTWDEASKTIHFKGKMVDPQSGKEEDVRETFKLVDSKTQFMEMFGTKDGKEIKWMEITFKKK
jgi:hypothetical protein